MKIAHIINITEINEAKKKRHLHIAQPLTMKSMVLAKKMAKGIMEIELFAIKHKSEEVDIPEGFKWTEDMDTYAWEHIKELKSVKPHKPLPRIHDIISNLYKSSDAEYLIYTNLDIALCPNFYIRVKELIEEGYESIFINRRDLPKTYHDIPLDENNLELAFTIEGLMHIGIDCCIFKRNIVPSMQFGNVFIGFPPIGQVIKSQAELHSQKSIWIKDEKLTFHIGRDQHWDNRADPYFIENMSAATGLYTKQFKKTYLQRKKKKLKRFIKRIIFGRPKKT